MAVLTVVLVAALVVLALLPLLILCPRKRAYTYRREIDLTGAKPKGRRAA